MLTSIKVKDWTDAKIKDLLVEDKPKRYKDRDGLVIEVRPSKKKVFLFRFQWDKKPQTINYLPCRNPLVSGKQKCRMHGGAKGSGAKKGNINALTHGETTTEVKALRAEIRTTIQHCKKMIKDSANYL